MKRTDEVFLVLPGDKVPPSLRRVMPFLLIALVVGVLLNVSFSLPSKSEKSGKPPVHSKLAGTVAGHDLRADIDASSFFVSGPGGASIEFPRHSIGIEEERLLLDGKEVAPVPPGAKLSIVVSGSKICVTSNGKMLLRTTVRR